MRSTVSLTVSLADYDGGNFTNWAAITGPIFKGVEGHDGDVGPTAMTDCTFFGNVRASLSRALLGRLSLSAARFCF